MNEGFKNDTCMASNFSLSLSLSLSLPCSMFTSGRSTTGVFCISIIRLHTFTGYELVVIYSQSVAMCNDCIAMATDLPTLGEANVLELPGLA